MRTARKRCGLAIAAVSLVSCGQKLGAPALPKPLEIAADSVGHFCGMLLFEHPGPKGQIFLSDRTDPVWFASVSETFAFTMLEEEPKNIVAIYVTDMGRATDWQKPGPGTWVDATKAFYVIGGRRRGGMGEDEAVPFADAALARQFVLEGGGRVVAFNAVPKDYILSHSGDAAGRRAGPDPPGAKQP